MHPTTLRLGLAAFVVLTGGLATNVFVLQPPARGIATSTAERLSGLESRERSDTSPIVPAVLPQEAPPPAVAKVAPNAELTGAIQRELRAKGYETGADDGSASLLTRAAIMAYEADQGLPLTGEPAQALLQHLILGSIGGDVPAKGTATGSLGPEATEIVRAAQVALKKLGYPVTTDDGHLADDTVGAIRVFEQDQRMTVTGRISGELMAKLTSLAGAPPQR